MKKKAKGIQESLSQLCWDWGKVRKEWDQQWDCPSNPKALPPPQKEFLESSWGGPPCSLSSLTLPGSLGQELPNYFQMWPSHEARQWGGGAGMRGAAAEMALQWGPEARFLAPPPSPCSCSS